MPVPLFSIRALECLAILFVCPHGQVLDCGCGVGGPGRNIAAFTGAQVPGAPPATSIFE